MESYHYLASNFAYFCSQSGQPGARFKVRAFGRAENFNQASARFKKKKKILPSSSFSRMTLFHRFQLITAGDKTSGEGSSHPSCDLHLMAAGVK